jgi:hypothetical protein
VVEALFYEPQGHGFDFRCHWIFQLTMTVGSIQPLREMSSRNHPGGKGRPARKADITAICEPIV